MDWQTSPLRPRLVVSRSTCPSLSPSPHANSFVIGTAVINTHTHERENGSDSRVTNNLGELLGHVLVTVPYWEWCKEDMKPQT
jgi:hypothetical protein